MKVGEIQTTSWPVLWLALRPIVRPVFSYPNSSPSSTNIYDHIPLSLSPLVTYRFYSSHLFLVFPLPSLTSQISSSSTSPLRRIFPVTALWRLLDYPLPAALHCVSLVDFLLNGFLSFWSHVWERTVLGSNPVRFTHVKYTSNRLFRVHLTAPLSHTLRHFFCFLRLILLSGISFTAANQHTTPRTALHIEPTTKQTRLI